jgi:ATP-binding cassette subfamily B protein
VRRLAAILDEQPLPEASRPAAVRESGALEFASVGFAYRTDAPVLREVSFRVPPRTMTAIIGASGSGKTTITRLVMRFHDVTSGCVSVGGTDVRDLSTADLMAQLAPVMQDVYLFDDSLEANILTGRPDASTAEVREAARLAGDDEIVARLPQGWQTPVGEGGTALSGGERQRVSLARAMLKNAPIVLLDEATAALDPQNERFVQGAIHSLIQRSTLLVIAHKLSTIVAADQILVLDGGRIVERGTHEQLLAADGQYAAFWNERSRARGWRLIEEPAAP